MIKELGFGIKIEVTEINNKKVVIKDNSMASDSHRREIL